MNWKLVQTDNNTYTQLTHFSLSKMKLYFMETNIKLLEILVEVRRNINNQKQQELDAET